MSFDLLDRFEIAGIARDELLLAAANAILLIVSVILVARRRKCQPLRFRDPYLLIATVTASFLSNFGAMTINRIEYPHCAIAMITFLPLLSSMVLICARFWKLFLASQITQARLTNQLESWILRHPRVRSSRWLWQVIVLLTGLLTLVELGLGLSSPVCARSDAVYFWTSFLMVAYWLVIGALTWKLRRLQDGFFVARELKMLGVVIFLSNLVVIPVVGGEERRQPPTIPLIISSILQLIIQTWYPLWKSLKMAPNVDAVHDRDESNGSRTSLAVLPTASTAKKSGIWSVPLTETSNVREVLRHPVGFGVMKRFLTLEFSIENLLCWQQLDENRRERRPSQVQAHFNAIYETFVRPGSPNEVNISAQLKKHFENVIHGKPVDLELIMKMKAPKVQTGTSQPDAGTDIKLRLLKQLYRDIIKVMQMDSFQRFRQTAEFQDLIRSNADIRVVTAKS